MALAAALTRPPGAQVVLDGIACQSDVVSFWVEASTSTSLIRGLHELATRPHGAGNRMPDADYALDWGLQIAEHGSASIVIAEATASSSPP
jgi:hypothetical protein